MILLMESPIAFRWRDIFTEAEPLRRARMPRDSRAMANEEGYRNGVSDDFQATVVVEDGLIYLNDGKPKEAEN